MNNHTPSPRDFAATRQGVMPHLVSGQDGVPVADCRTEDDARLIAAAPDLYELLLQAVARVELLNEEGNPAMSAWLPDARAALARVQG